MSILKELPVLNQLDEMAIVQQNLHGSHLNAKALVDIVTLLALTEKKDQIQAINTITSKKRNINPRILTRS